MFLILYKIDWGSFVRDFPAKKDTWTRELKSDDFDYRDEADFATEWAEFAWKLRDALPQSLSDSFSQLAAVVFPENDGVKLPHVLTKKDKERLPYPHFDPTGMQEVFEAIEDLTSHDIHSHVRAAWESVEESEGCDLQYFEDVNEYLSYMDIWVAVLA